MTDAPATADSPTFDANVVDASDPSIARIEATCRKYDECGVLTTTVEECVTNTTTSYGTAVDNCPDDAATLDAMLVCIAAASCPIDASTCEAEGAAVAEVFARCL